MRTGSQKGLNEEVESVELAPELSRVYREPRGSSCMPMHSDQASSQMHRGRKCLHNDHF